MIAGLHRQRTAPHQAGSPPRCRIGYTGCLGFLQMLSAASFVDGCNSRAFEVKSTRMHDSLYEISMTYRAENRCQNSMAATLALCALKIQEILI